MTVCHSITTRFAIDSDAKLHVFGGSSPVILSITEAERLHALLPDMIGLAKKLHPLHSASDLPSSTAVAPTIGAPFAGGFFAGFDMDDKRYAIVVAPKAEGQREDIAWKDALGFCAGLRIGGFDDWRAPTKDELYTVYRSLGPNVTDAAAFKDGQPEAYDERWYWSSTEYDSDYAWIQNFDDGGQDYDGKGHRLRVRAVRKVLI